MKRLLAAIVILLSAPFAAAQATPITGQVLNLYGGYVPNASVRVCSVTSSGTPCTPTASIYQDYALTVPLGNPTSADQYGNFTFYVPALTSPNMYLVQVTPSAGVTWSYVYPGPGVSVAGGTMTGALTDTFGFIGPLTGAVNGTVGATTPNTGAFTTLSASGLITATGGVSGNLTGTVTGHSTLDLPLTGGALTGAVTSSSTFSAVTFSGSVPGSFTGSNLLTENPFVVNSCSPASLYSSQQLGASGLEGVTGCVAAPAGSTIHQVNGVGGYATTVATTTMAVGGYFTGTALVNGTSAWGMNNVVTDTAGMTSGFLWGIEDDCNLQGNAGVRLWCLNMTGRWTHQPTGTAPDQAIAVKINQPLNNSLALAYQWNIGINIDNASTQGPAIQVGARAGSGTNIASQWISFFGFNGSGNPVDSIISMDANQNIALSFDNISTHVDKFSPAGNATFDGIVQGGTVLAAATGIDQDTSMSNVASGLLAGHWIGISAGQSTGSNYNHATFGMNFTGGAGSTSNTAFIGLFGGPELTLDGLGNLKLNGLALMPNLVGTTGSIGGGALTAGQCASGTASITGAVAGQTGAAAATDGTYQAGYTVQALGTGSGTATVYVCAIAAGTPTAKTYNVRLFQ